MLSSCFLDLLAASAKCYLIRTPRAKEEGITNDKEKEIAFRESVIYYFIIPGS